MPAPEEGSKPAMVRTFFIKHVSIFCKNIAYFGAERYQKPAASMSRQYCRWKARGSTFIASKDWVEKKFNNDYDEIRDIDLWHDGCYIKVLVFDECMTEV
jgi:hypothetical protein